ncbi:MAG: hypothetical protein B7X90_10085 [Novosphingobium sp. 17-62-19]|uniref:SIMPL domain-containing protein n=1 Tax=Novosphingobium sp. 17-62-19 TaxID=1970406 RepID=UPI000BD30D92|nr:SIMPL domain-containing protein [Novosphingobium sp. 17-62-19]OYX91032.1 MAG: hypothetical protein B7Y74_15370 [Novosphingobium sp. 35-62-5]OZA19043.1 MAG: hypothetical protein B7X90_10085 [Novosphingobium sp. 17-62-19]HQS97257.1 SIMPL domain-containing protein [Novosphingobium sp.]
MKRKFLFAAALAALTPLAAQAQVMSSGPVVGAGNTLLNIAAEGKSTRTPDLAVFNAGVTTQGKTAGEALTENAQRMTSVIAALRKGGIAERDIQTSNLSVNPVYGQPKRLADGSIEERDPVIVGYQATNQVSVRQRKLDQYGKVIDTLVAAGANQVNGPSFQIDSPDAAMDEARLEAMKTARARADLYARAAGLRVVRVLSISENAGWSPPQPQAMFARAEMASAPKSSPVAAGELEMTVTVNVSYELAN